MRTYFLLIVSFFLMLLDATAQQQSARSELTGDWGGVRDSLEANGLFISSRITLFNQNFIKGKGANKGVFNGKAQLGLDYNGAKIGLSKWTLVTKAEYNFGSALDSTGQTLLPKNTAIAIPGYTSGNRFDISSLYLVYNWKASDMLLLGKVNLIDLAASMNYTGGAGLDAFWNIGFSAPLTGITPAYIFGAVASIQTKKIAWTFMAYDPEDAVRKSGLNRPFDEGIVLSVSSGLKANIGNSEGNHVFQLAYSSQDGANLYNLSNLTPPIQVPLSDKKNRYFFGYTFDHSLKQLDEENSWGVFGEVGVSDGNPNPLDFSFVIGLGGSSFIKNRVQDTWGLAFYDYSLSKIIDEEAANLGLPLGNELGLELFYQYWATNWFSIGADLQVISPVVKASETAVFLGFRSSIKL
ncbi:carbohydrate porin [Algoriphagus sp.]|uniref:carbohydrate porin n=1 Tax=Algoriphagus sp. TaxID=1872435 RepID=UPI0032942E21